MTLRPPPLHLSSSAEAQSLLQQPHISRPLGREVMSLRIQWKIGTIDLGPLVELCPNLRHVEVAPHSISAKDVEAIRSALKSVAKLTVHTFRSTRPTLETLDNLVQLMPHVSDLSFLRTVPPLTETSEKDFPGISSLRISNYRMNGVHSHALCPLLDSHNSLRALSITFSYLDQQGCRDALANALETTPYSRLTRLELATDDPNITGALFARLIRAGPALRVLVAPIDQSGRLTFAEEILKACPEGLHDLTLDSKVIPEPLRHQLHTIANHIRRGCVAALRQLHLRTFAVASEAEKQELSAVCRERHIRLSFNK